MNTSPRMVMSVYLGNSDEALIQLHKRIPKKLKVVKWPIFWVPLEFLLKMTFRVMNKVMNNLKNLCNSIVIQSSEWECKKFRHSKKFKNAREINLSGVFFYFIHKEVYKELTKNLSFKLI